MEVKAIMKKLVLLGLVLSFLLSFVSSAKAGDSELVGAGATFPYPLYSKMFEVYHEKYGVSVNYQSIGSGGGQRQLLSRTVDFGASDGFMNNDQLAKAPAKIVHIPMVLGADVVSYNLPGRPELRFTPDVIADIFLGRITQWDDARIKANNPGVSLPSDSIVVVHRSDGSGTTHIFTDYLCKVSHQWASRVGEGVSVSWPVGLGAKGNEGVAGLIQQTPNSIGYVELIYAAKNHMSIGVIKNKSGKFIHPSISSIAAAANIPQIPEDTRVFITDSSAPGGYPLSGFTWILVYQDQNYGGRSEERAQQLVKLLWWMAHQGQQYAASLDYVQLPQKALTKTEKIIESIHYGGKRLLAEGKY